jgi:MFS family permease
MSVEGASGAAARAAAPAVNSPHARRNFRLGLLSGSLGTLAFDFLDPELVLAGMIYQLTHHNFLVALVVIMHKAGMLAPQLWVGSRLEHLPRKGRYFVAVTVVRAAALALVVGSIGIVVHTGALWPLGLFFAAYLVSCASGGSGHVIFMDMAGRTIPAQRVGTFFGLRHFLGGLASVVVGLVLIQPVVAHVKLPLNYLILVAIGAAVSVASMTVWSLTKEDAGPTARRRGSLGESLRRGVRWLKEDRDYRAYLLLRVSFRICHVALVFFIPFGQERLRYDSPGGIALLAGIMVASRKASRVGASLVWGRLVDRLGYRCAMLGGGICFALAPWLMLRAPQLPEAFRLVLPGLEGGLSLPICVYLLALMVHGAGQQGMIIGGSRFLVRSAPPHRRISYVGFMNTITSPLTLLPLLGAWVADAYGMDVLLVGVMGGGVLALAAALYMRPERTERMTNDAA